MEYRWLKPRTLTIVHTLLILGMIYIISVIVSYFKLGLSTKFSPHTLLTIFVILPMVIIYTLVCVIENERSKS